MLVKLLQPLNARSPILVTPSRIVTLVKLLQPLNAQSPIQLTVEGIVKLCIEKLANEIKENINLNTYNYKILLTHYPDSVTSVLKYNFDLIASGHSLNGQVRLPFIVGIVLPNGAKKYYKEYYKLNNTDLYISSGIGTSQISFRLFNRPSINFYRLTNK